MKDHRQVVKCEARNPCYAMFNNKAPKAATENKAIVSVTPFGVSLSVVCLAGVPCFALHHLPVVFHAFGILVDANIIGLL